MLWQLWNSCFPVAGKLPGHTLAAPRRNVAHSVAAGPASHESLIFTALLAHGATAACVLSREGRCLQISPNFQSITGIEPGQCYQMGLLNHFSEQDQQALRDACMHADAQTETQRFMSLAMEAEESTQMLALEWSLLPTERGAQHVIMLVRDASTEWQAMQAAEQANTRVAVAEKGRDDFLANMSHELRTPLNAVLGFAQMMEQQVFGRINNPTYRDYVKKIQESGQDLLHKINDLLHVSSLDAASPTRADVAPLGVPVPLNTLLREAIESFTHQAFRKDMRITPVLLDPQPIVMAERLELYGAVAQLLSNAVKFGKTGSTVKIVCRAHRDKGISIHVLDRSEGISATLIQRINASLKRRLLERGREDIGLGLAVAGEYMRRHGGSIQLRNRTAESGDMGTEAILTLPRQRIRWEKMTENSGSTKRSSKAQRNTAVAG
jgi:signal transduction histidine kinase